LREGVRKPKLKAAFRNGEPLAKLNHFANEVKPATVEVQIALWTVVDSLAFFPRIDAQLV
jgi:hypothetical protein